MDDFINLVYKSISMQSWDEIQALEHRINLDIYNPYTVVVELLLDRNSYNRPTMIILRCKQIFEADLTMPVVSLISCSVGRCVHHSHQLLNNFWKLFLLIDCSSFIVKWQICHSCSDWKQVKELKKESQLKRSSREKNYNKYFLTVSWK